MKFHKLTVTEVDRLCPDALMITFAVPAGSLADFAFQPGQHLTFDPELRRSYSLCSPPSELRHGGTVRIGVRVLPGGAFSAAAMELQAGDIVEAMPPLGRFGTDFVPGRVRRYGAIVAGSGITPVLSLIAAGLEIEQGSTFAVLFGNRTSASVMFADELADLKDRYPDRLQVLHVLSREAHDIELFHGRLDTERVERLLPLVGPVDEWFLCGPQGMVEGARQVLSREGAAIVHTELFHADSAGPSAPSASTAQSGDVTVTIKLDGRATSLTMDSGERVLDAALRVRPELPFACRGGVCSTCRARVVEGNVNMVTNWALEPEDVAAGYVLTCQAVPTSENLVVDYDA
ncbi:ring-1,2-phenylacetyl-CoA epoxidase subunit PaaE [Allocatelliglobosispora scoriae]|uniref:Ring-1,2-phenylacetyl-CoA epoxidase subunit PaaE n=1 Tax=Allocatelliglobosispora scoriae TaxID=643052 RepID=A0A841BVH6_9ACTN|nr:2Fe-2S iron-sulfur cluster-binding protein [Allocatelliglobosispora scoriae]MBB5870751.1 ring-1,2-phenylacetyl-CoA epoxidase subunit PaaE [Allocatelliglobosispora scoriae]